MQRFQKKRGTLRTDLIQTIARCIHRPFAQVAALTVAWTEDMLKDGAFEAERDPIKFWVYRKSTIPKPPENLTKNDTEKKQI